MRRWCSAGVLAAAFVAAAGGGILLHAGSSRAAPAGLIVFASDRGKANPGEIYSLAPGSAPRDVSRSLAGDYGLAVAPVGDQIAFWSTRSGADAVYLARSDGSHVRRVRALGASPAPLNAGGGGPLEFSADGTRLFASRSPGAFAVDTRTATAHALAFCDAGILRPSPDGRLLACGGNSRTTVYTAAGTLRFSFHGGHPIWSSRGWLTNQPEGARWRRSPPRRSSTPPAG